MKHNIKTGLLVLVVLLMGTSPLVAQVGYSLQQLIDAAKKNNHLIAIKEYQVQEKLSKLKEDGIRRYPTPTVDGTYQYNFKLPDITVPAGSLGAINTGDGNTQLLPSQDSKFNVGQKGSYNVGLNIYQPISQQFKINTGLEIDKTEIKLVQKEKEKTLLQLQLAVKQLYYGALISQKQIEGETIKLELANSRLYDAESTLFAGKITGVNISGLRANIASQEQNLLKLNIQVQDYLSELARITGLNVEGLKLQQEEPANTELNAVNDYKNAATNNPDIEIARLNKEKAMLGVKVAKQSNLPDFGFVTGYYLQEGSPILPTSSPYIGLSLKWNILDLFSNKQVQNQRLFQLKQAEENIAYTRQQVESDIDKGWRKVKQSEALISAAKKLVGYRKNALKEQQDKQNVGLDIKTALLETKSLLAEAEANLYAAQLSGTIAIAELNNLTGQTTKAN